MELMVKPSFVEFRYEAVLKESMLSVTVEESRISLIKKFLKAFDLRLNDIKFDGQALSNNYIHFSKFYGPTFFEEPLNYSYSALKCFKGMSLQIRFLL
jgi:hypothetical protein